MFKIIIYLMQIEHCLNGVCSCNLKNIVYNIIGLIKQFLKMKVFFILTAIFIYYRIHGTPIVVCHVCVINIENVYILL